MKQLFLILLLFVSVVYSATAQNSAQATMQVSVKVVEGSSVETLTPHSVILTSNSSVDLGSLLLKGSSSENSVITMSSAVILSNGKGNNIKLDVNSRVEDHNSEASTKFAFSGFVPADIKADYYEGELSTTIEYF